MTFSTLAISYCTNAHPGQTVAEVEAGLDQFTKPLLGNVGELAAGLWLARPVVSELLSDRSVLAKFADGLKEGGLTCYTLNTFPYGNFHDARVKENVYLPDWADHRRLEYTRDCAAVLATLLPDDQSDGSLSTVPLGFKGFEHPSHFTDQCCRQLISLSRSLGELEDRTGKCIRLAIEPEPFCVLETTAETIEFFRQLRSVAAAAGALEMVNRYLGLCYDVCHQSVEFEDVVASINSLRDESIPIVKIHITCAIRLISPQTNLEARQLLATFAEPRYLHQTMARRSDGSIARLIDLTASTALTPPEDFASASEWRVHFHVPVNAEHLGPLETTHADLRAALAAVHDLPYAPHLEVETYTWNVLPGAQPVALVDGLTAEVLATRAMLDELSAQSLGGYTALGVT